MVQYCCAVNCTNSSDVNREFIFHSFPNAEKDNERRQKWIHAIKRKNWQPGKNTKLCSAHFLPEDYDPPVVCGKYHLKKSAIPSVFDYPVHLQPKKVSEGLRLIHHVTSNQFQNNISCKIENDAYPSDQKKNGELYEIQSETDEKNHVLGINYVPKTSNLRDALVQSAEHDQVKVEDVYTTNSSMPSLKTSSNDPYKVETKPELFTEEIELDEPAEKVAEYNYSVHSTIYPPEVIFVSTNGLHNAEVKLEQFSEEENSNTDPCSTEEPLEQHLEEVTLPKPEYSDEDSQPPNLTIPSLEKSYESRNNAEVRPGCSKHQENSSQGPITPSAKKGKHLPSVKKSTQHSGNVSNEVNDAIFPAVEFVEEPFHKSVAVQTDLTGTDLMNTLSNLRREKKLLQQQLKRRNARL
ncbi:THAP domain-containing protein 5-like isoform X2 [Planococcus citri]|uniref:THAP domain-containing protein 5-like isoform X2 n=1 Tax=Planococcus citri TaxID=170843 RepID=UPI0031F9A8CF